MRFAASATRLILVPILIQKMETATLASDRTLFAALTITIFAIGFTAIFAKSLYHSSAVVNGIADLRLSPAPTADVSEVNAEINKNNNIQVVNHNVSIKLHESMTYE